MLWVFRGGPHGGEHLSVDLTDREACVDVFSRMSDVTHVVYAALYEKPGLIKGWFERDQMETNLTMLKNLFDPLEAAAQLEHVTLMQGTKAYGVHHGAFEVPAKERNPRHQHENFY
jgi:nucleoside-diphosphate-sugar epimerase